jgi:hypothetical protein
VNKHFLMKVLSYVLNSTERGLRVPCLFRLRGAGFLATQATARWEKSIVGEEGECGIKVIEPLRR